MRVLTLTNMYPSAAEPFRGIFVAEQVASLRKRGTSSPLRGSSTLEGGIETDVLFVNGPRSRWNYLRGVAELRRALQAAHYDLIHAHYVFSGMIALTQALYFPARRRLPIVLTHHGIEAQRGWTAPLCRWTSRRVTRTIATSRRVQEALRLPGVEIVPCGVDTDLFRPQPQGQARAALGLPVVDPRQGTDTPLVLFAGMRRPEKRFDLVVAAVELLRATRPEVQLVVADSEPHERMPLFMNACDVLILASEGEGSPMVIKEAMACNLPIVSVDVGDVAEVIGRTAGRTSPIEGCFLVERPSSSKEQDLRSHRLKGLDGARPKRWSSRLKAVSRPTFGHPKLSAWSRYGPSWPTLRQAQGDALRQAQGDALRQAQGDARPTHCVSPEENLPQALAARLAEALDFGGRTAGRERIMALSLDAIAGRLEEIYRDVIAKESRRSPSGGRIE